jgi:predicted acyltransferase
VGELARSRLTSVDVLRGITVAAMLLVNDPGDPANVFGQLRHSAWHGCTFADLVFPSFLFVVGITTHLSLARRTVPTADATPSGGDSTREIVRRAAVLFCIGLVLNAWPFFEKSQVAGPPWLPSAAGHVVARLAELRITGVLQRIAMAYLVAALFVQRASTRAVCVAVVAILLGYWGALTLLPVPGHGVPGHGVLGARLLDDPARNLAAWVDHAALDWTRWGLGWHLWDRQVPFDPEGLLSTIPAVATVLLGVLAGRWLTFERPLRDRLAWLAGAGVAALMVGLVWGLVFPINKALWTSSYVLVTGGAVSITLAFIAWIVDVRQWTRWTTPALVFGTNPIVGYVGAELLATVFRSSLKWKLDDHRVGTDFAVTHLLRSIGVEAQTASLLWSLSFLAVCYALLRILYRKGIMVRV